MAVQLHSRNPKLIYLVVKSDFDKSNSDFKVDIIVCLCFALWSSNGCTVAFLKSNIDLSYIVKSDFDKTNSDFKVDIIVCL